jgi:outer membrane protein OmpA-like peptidoglycan-associated protein
VALGRAYLEKANKTASISRDHLEQVMAARQMAMASGADKLFAKDFLDADAKLMNVTRDIESNNRENVISRKAVLQSDYLNLELRGIKHSFLDRSNRNVEQAKKEGAEKFAPKSLTVAQSSFQETDAFINANRYDSEEIKMRAMETERISDRLLKITRAAKSGSDTPEDLAIVMQNEHEKVLTTTSELTSTENQLAMEQSHSSSKERALSALTEKNQDLVSEQVLNERYEVARKEFTNKEAEVYRDGKILMIRLKGLEFPSSKSDLNDKNYPLLSKVQGVIKNFGKASVVVEGHTDSLGGKKANEKISVARAESVKNYLQSNAGDEPLNISAMGYDYQKPLASNKTPMGRAQNRRVDILINPEGNVNL